MTRVRCKNCGWEGDPSELIILLDKRLVPPTCPKCLSQDLSLIEEQKYKMKTFIIEIREDIWEKILSYVKEKTRVGTLLTNDTWGIWRYILSKQLTIQDTFPVSSLRVFEIKWSPSDL